jgi:hypothetical protein
MPRTRWSIVVAAMALAARASAGQGPPAASPPAPEPPSPPVVVTEPPVSSPDPWSETEVTVDKATQVAAGVGFGGPTGAAVSVRFLHGLAADVREDEGRVKAVCAVPIPHCAQGFLFAAGAGSGGGKLSLGVGARARVEEEDFRGTVGVALRAALVRTWGSPIGTDPGLTYLGPELDLSIIRVNVSLGVLWRVSGHGGKSALFAWGVGFGL